MGAKSVVPCRPLSSLSADKCAPTLRVYFRNFIRIFWYFNRLFRLNLLYFRRKHRLIDRMQTYSLCHESTMRPPHACYVIRARDDRSNRKRRFRSTSTPALPSQFRNALDQLESRTSPSHSAESSQVHHLHNNGPFHHITDASRQKYYYIWVKSFTIVSFFILKFRLTL